MRKACRICTGGMEREMNKETESGKTYPDDIKSEGPEKKDIAKAYEKYAKQFTPKPDYLDVYKRQLPDRADSPGRPSLRGEAPMANITDLHLKSPLVVNTVFSLSSRFKEYTFAKSVLAP